MKAYNHRRRHFGDGISLGIAYPVAEALASLLSLSGEGNTCRIAGSVRRGQDVIKKIDLVASSEMPEKVVKALCAHPSVAQVLVRSDSMATVRLNEGVEIVLRVVPDFEFAPALRYWTGSKAHNLRLYRQFGPPPAHAESEEEIYRELGLLFIPPELREDRGEFEAASSGILPSLVEQGDIRGDLHIHALADGGTDRLEEFAACAVKMGYEYVAITDHARSPSTPYGLNGEGIRDRMRKIEHLNRRLEGLTLLAGIEANIGRDGSIDLPATLLADLDLVIASVHSDFRMPKKEMTWRVTEAIQSYEFHILGHPTGRIIGRRGPANLDLPQIFETAAECGVLLELNAHPARIDLRGEHCRDGKGAGCAFSLGSDAHRPKAMGSIVCGIAQARRGWLERSDLANTQPLSALLHRLKH